jgi:hypothetical protein
MKMKNNLIRVFVNEKTIIEISQYASLYSLKDEVNKKIYDSAPIDDISLHFNGKPLTDDTKALLSYGIENDSNLFANVKTNGGMSTSTIILMVLYICSIPLYFLFLASGLPPVMANIFSFVFDNTVVKILEFFGQCQTDPFVIIIRKFVKFIMWTISTFATVMFVWITVAYLVFPFYYLIRGRTYCDAGVAAKHVGKVTTIWYMMIYGAYNVIDFLLNIIQYLTNMDPILLIKGASSASIQVNKEAWDIAKFTPFYAIPFVGEILMVVHEVIEEGVGLLYEALDTISQIQCTDEQTTSMLCSLMTQLEVALARYGGTGHMTHSKENKSIATKHKKRNINQQLNQRLSKKASSLEVKEMAGAFIEPIKNYKLEPLIKLMQRGFCDQALKDKMQQSILNKGLEPLTDEQLNSLLPPLPGTEFDMNTFGGRLNRWSTGFATSFFCQILEALSDITNTLWGIGTESQVVNMIKTGQIAGIVSILVIIIDTFLN